MKYPQIACSDCYF